MAIPGLKQIANDFNNAAPSGSCAAVTPSDTTSGLLANTSRGLYVGGTGNMAVVTANGETVLFSGIPAGMVLPVMANQVNSTSTTATLIVALF